MGFDREFYLLGRYPILGFPLHSLGVAAAALAIAWPDGVTRPTLPCSPLARCAVTQFCNWIDAWVSSPGVLALLIASRTRAACLSRRRSPAALPTGYPLSSTALALSGLGSPIERACLPPSFQNLQWIGAD